MPEEFNQKPTNKKDLTQNEEMKSIKILLEPSKAKECQIRRIHNLPVPNQSSQTPTTEWEPPLKQNMPQDNYLELSSNHYTYIYHQGTRKERKPQLLVSIPKAGREYNTGPNNKENNLLQITA